MSSGLHAPSSPSRRTFLRSMLGVPLVLGLSACDQNDPSAASEIDEGDFKAFNRQYYALGVDERTQFPHTHVTAGVPSGRTEPVAIALRLQALVDEGAPAAGRVETLLDHLLRAQVNPPNQNYRGMLPAMAFADTDDGFERLSPEFYLPHNAMLAMRVATAARAFAGTPVEEKALIFLANQKDGYNFYLARSPQYMPYTGNADTRDPGSIPVDLLFSGHYDAMAFAFSYFVGGTDDLPDPQAGPALWRNLTLPENLPLKAYTDTFTGRQVIAPLSRNGSAFQYFHPLLGLAPDRLPDTFLNALYNALYLFLDAAVVDGLPGVYSAGPNGPGTFLEDNGLNRLAAGRIYQGSIESLATVDALAAALRLFSPDSAERRTLRQWIGRYDATAGSRTAYGLNGAIDKQGNVIPSMFVRQNGAMILFDSNAVDYVEAFLTDQGKPTLHSMFDDIQIDAASFPLPRTQAGLPPPPEPDQLFR